MTIIHKELAKAKGEGMTFVLSDGTTDRYGDIVSPDGWDLKNFKKNPIALFGHNNNFIVGLWENIRVEGNKLLGDLSPAKRGTSYRIDEILGLLEQGILRAVSVGFKPLKSEPLNPEKPYGPQRFLRQELLEASLVSVPALPTALAVAKSMNISTETLDLVFGEHAEPEQVEVSRHGEHAAKTTVTERPKAMKTLSDQEKKGKKTSRKTSPEMRKTP